MKRALVTGCSRGIGRAVTLALLRDGWDVIGVSRTRPSFLPTPGLTWVEHDVGYVFGLDRLMVDWIDAFVHCAAVQGPVGAFMESDPLDWADCIETNLNGMAYMLRSVLPYLRKSDDGRALLFAGGGAFNPRMGYSAYAASKAGVVSLMETVAAELEETNVTVNCVSPGYVPTSMTAGEDGPSPQLDRAVGCVMYLLSPATKGLTGKTISAEYDDWALITPDMVESLNLSNLGTRHRYLIRMEDSQRDSAYRSYQTRVPV